MKSIKQAYKNQEKEIVEGYLTLLRFPTISSEAGCNKAIKACIEWLCDYLTAMGMETEVWETIGHPVLFASHLKAGKDRPTLLFYNHYDVQPVDPVEKWTTPPFEPAIRDGQVFARGAQDNKGQLWYTLQGIRLLLERDDTLPFNIKLCIEGEEECGSQGLSTILPEKKEQLSADYLAIGDSGIPTLQKPAITLGMRGILTMDLLLQGAKSDLHSGTHGGIAPNPIHALTDLLAKLHDPGGRVAVPGFYDAVKEIPEKELSRLSFPFSPAEYQQFFGVNPVGGERQLPMIERAWLQPTLEINGIFGGYSGSGFKTVIPATAGAKISCRLVPNQRPEEVGQQVADFLKREVQEGIAIEIKVHKGSGEAIRTDPNSPLAKAFLKAYSELFQTPCTLILEGGSIPIATELAKLAGARALLFGLGLPTDQIHAPNEHFGLDRLEMGAQLVARTIEMLVDYSL